MKVVIEIDPEDLSKGINQVVSMEDETVFEIEDEDED